jgi:toxic anion resistance family protein
MTENILTPQVSLPSTMSNQSQYKLALRELDEVKKIRDNEIKLNDGNSILNFGQTPSEGLSKISNQLLATTKRPDADNASAMIVQLTKVMDKFDIKEIETMPIEKQNMFVRIFNNAKNKLDKLVAKYENLGKEVDEISLILQQSKHEMEKSNDSLKRLYQANLQYYEMLEKYIVAGEMALEEIDKELNELPTRTNITEEQKQMNIQQLNMIRDILSQRVGDLRVAENVALQTAPMLQMMQMGNFNLMRKINSSFIITLPIFKNSLIQAIELKRQAITSNSINQLDQKTAELWERNAKNTAQQYVTITEQANRSVLPIEKLKESFETIQKGIEDANEINQKQEELRKENAIALEDMKEEMKKKGFIGMSTDNQLRIN